MGKKVKLQQCVSAPKGEKGRHFENCKKAPNPSQKSIEEREELRQRMLGFNTNKEKDTE